MGPKDSPQMASLSSHKYVFQASEQKEHVEDGLTRVLRTRLEEAVSAYC